MAAMDKKSESDVNSEDNKTAITEAEEVESEFGNGKTDDTDSVSKRESTEVLKSASKGEENKDLASTSKGEMTEVVESTAKCERIKVVGSTSKGEVVEPVFKSKEPEAVKSTSGKEPEVVKSARKDTGKKIGESESIVICQDVAEKLQKRQIKEEVEDIIDSQETECMDVQEAADLQKSPIISQHIAEETPEKMSKEVGDGQKKEGKDFGGVDDASSSLETYCSESSFERSECTTNRSIHITLESDSDSHILSAGTGSCGGVSQATTVDVADLEVLPSSETDMFASQSYQEDTDALGDSSGTVADYNDFVKKSRDGSQTLIKCSSSLSMDEPPRSSSKLVTPVSKSARKRKKVESDSSDPASKLQRIAEEVEGNVQQESLSEEGSSLGVDVLPASTSMDCGAKSKTSLPVLSPTKVTLKEKEVEISPKADRQQHSVMTTPKASRRLNFEAESELVEKQKAQFVLFHSSSKDNIEKIEECKTGDEEEGQNITDSPCVQSSPEIEILNTKKSRQSIEVVFISSHSHDSARSSSQHKTSSGRKRSAEDVEEVIDIEDHVNGKKAVDTAAESSDEELILHLSPSPTQKSVDLQSMSEKSSGSYSVNHTSYSSYKSSNADSLKLHSRSEQETSNTKKQDKRLVSKKSSVYPIMEEDEEELKEPEKSSQIQSSGSTSNSEHTIGSGNAIREKISTPFSLSKQNIVSPESSPSITDSFTTFSKVKDVAQLTSRQFVTPDSESQGRMSKRKRDNGKKDIPVVSLVGSDSESDSHSTPSEVQKKTKTDVANGHKDTPSILTLLPSSLLQKGSLRCHSTPQTDHTIPVSETSASSIEQDATQVNETEWDVIIRVKMKCSKQSNKEVFRVHQCEDVTDDINHRARRLSDYNSSGGGLGDISSKNTSPSSTTSGPGPFSLLPSRLSLISTISSSSSSSGGSSVALGVVRSKYTTDGGQFLMPNNPGPKMSRDRLFRSEEALSGIRSGIHNSFVEGMETIERILINSYSESPERIQGGSTRTIKPDSETKADVQKPSDRYTPPDDFPQECIDTKTADDTGSTNVAIDVVPTPANVLKETPKSSTKSFKRSKSRSSANKRALPFSKSKEKENIGQEKNDSKIVPSVESKRGRQTLIRNRMPVSSSMEESITRAPKSKKKESSDSVIQNVPETPSVTRDITRTPEMSSEGLDDELKPGAPVFARWTDRKYYSGKVKEKGKEGRWIVLFDDGNVKSLLEDFIIVVDVLLTGQLVYAKEEDEDDYLPGIIIEIQKKRSGVIYSVEFEEGDVIEVSRSELFMTEDQAKILREDATASASSPSKSTPHRITDVSLDNVLEGKRSRIRSRELKSKLDMPGVSGVSKITSRRKGCSPVGTESDAGSSIEDVDGVERESLSRDVKLRKVKGQGRSNPRKNWDTLMGPIPPEGCKIFAGKYFLLTSSDVNQKTTRNDSEETDTPDTDQEDPHLIPFSKSYISEQITAGGGKLCSRFEEVPLHKYDSCYLITDRPNQTAKFILCLAHEIKIVLHSWIIHCCVRNTCLPISNHLAPAGWSLEKGGYVSRLKMRPLCLLEIGVVMETTNFLKFWQLVLRGAGASVYAITPETSILELTHLDVVVSNHSCPLEEQLRDLGKHVVTTNWIVQCLINGTICAFT